MIALLAMVMATSSNGLACSSVPDRIEIAVPANLDPAIRSIAVVRAGRWYTIVDEDHHLASYQAGTRRLTLPRRTQTAIDYRGGKERVVRAFPGPGSYRIVFADNLETEPENMVALSCTLRLR